MDAPTHYSDVCQKALDVKLQYHLTDVQTLLYNHICRGDFALRNGDGQSFYDENHRGFGHGSSREWVKNQLQPLIKAKLVSFTSLHDCRDKKYTSWYFYSPEFGLSDLIDASCYVSTHKIALIKHCLGLPDGFDKNAKHEKIRFSNRSGYFFAYKQEDGYSDSFQGLVHQIWDALAKDGFQYDSVPGYSEKRRFKI